MKRVVVRYTVKPDKVEENRTLIDQVFRELQSKTPDGVRYMVLQLADDSFLHVAETDDEAAGLPGLAAFQAFRHGLAERWIEPPQSREAAIVGNYRLKAD